MASVRIGIIGDYRPDYLYHQATEAALSLSARTLGLDMTHVWVPTGVLGSKGLSVLDKFDGLWASPGSPYQSMEGALAGIRFARERGKPFVGT
jgi:CTP synthase (UTP-ammonia lyase)